MPRSPRAVFSFEDYVRLEADSSVKHEFLDGVVYAISGGSPEHAAIAANVIRLLGDALAGKPCRVFTSDLRVRVAETGLATYPDVSVVCDRVELDPGDAKGHTALNPRLLVEVLSPSTESYDRGEKLAHYQRIATLQEVLLLAHDARHADVWRRGADGWTVHRFTDDEAVRLDSVDCELALADVYFDPLG